MNSYFKFEIAQTTEVLRYKIKIGDKHRWIVEGSTEDTEFKLCELKQPENYIIITSSPQKLHITTINGFEYEITDKKGDGANVLFHGPVNALLTQSLLPRMTYIPHTLLGKTDGMDEFVDIQMFMTIRQIRHGNKANPQDRHGWRVNKNFNNELVPWLPAARSQQKNNLKRKKAANLHAVANTKSSGLSELFLINKNFIISTYNTTIFQEINKE